MTSADCLHRVSVNPEQSDCETRESYFRQNAFNADPRYWATLSISRTSSTDRCNTIQCVDLQCCFPEEGPVERLRQKRPRLVLEPKEYDRLRNHVLGRDGWRCQCCGSLTNLQVHHLDPRSHLGSDIAGNLITLCSNCHRREHNLV
jgi:HNH endonuclease